MANVTRKKVLTIASEIGSTPKSACTEGAEAFFVGTHDPEAIAIAIKLQLGENVFDQNPLFFAGPIKWAKLPNLGLNMGPWPNIPQHRPEIGPTLAHHG